MKRIILLILLLMVPLATAKQGHMKLLAVKEKADGYEGSPADLYLEIKPGTGRVFLETFPLLKIDTQISTRFAKEMACDYLDMDCDNYDFIYTITADSVIIGGPSAGAAIATLTIAMLKNMDINENISITGTINSGGIVGSIGGIKEKIKAAGESGISVVLIPIGERFVKEEVAKVKNETVYKEIDLYEYGKKYNVRVIEVANLDDIMFIFTGKIKEKEITELYADVEYEKTMEKLADDLCSRSEKLKKNLAYRNDGEFNSTLNSALNLTEKGRAAFENKKYYSSASYCFGANVKFSNLFVLSQNLTKEAFLEKISVIEGNIKEFNRVLGEKRIRTITDLEAFMVVKDRLIEASDELKSAADGVNENKTKEASYKIAYASERVYSAYSWLSFFDNRGKKLSFNKENLKKTCQAKLKEAEERYRYVDSFIPNKLDETKRGIDLAYKDLANEDYELCLFKATKSKAELNAILSIMYIEEDKIGNIINQKLNIVKKGLIEQTKKGVFPILGYSYYEYANELNATDKSSSLLYSEYALELSNLGMYFKDKKKIAYSFNKEVIAYFILGVIAGFAISLITFIIFKTSRKERKTLAEHKKVSCREKRGDR